MRSLLLGNGINIQFGGKAYSNYFIMERIRFKAKMDRYVELFNNTLDGSTIVAILDEFPLIANDIRNGEYDKYVIEEDTKEALEGFKQRYPENIKASYEIMLEDWFFLLHMFFLKNADLTNNKNLATQGFEHLILDGIYNEGKIQNLYLKIPKQAKKFFDDFDNIFTLNYDDNMEKLTGKNVYHLHGEFNTLANSENPNSVQGYLRTLSGEIVTVKGMENSFCNALLNYSGMLKYKTAQAFHNLITTTDDWIDRYDTDSALRKSINDLKDINPLLYQMFMTKKEHPELNMAPEYYFDRFSNISDELCIIGMSPNNDDHIFKLITNNKRITKVIFCYFSEKEKEYVEINYPKDLFDCKNVNDLWRSLDCITPRYHCKYSLPSDIDKYIKIFNALSGSVVTKKQIMDEIEQIPRFEMERLYKILETDRDLQRLDNKPKTEHEFNVKKARISYIALQEGIYPSTLYLIYTMCKANRM